MPKQLANLQEQEFMFPEEISYGYIEDIDEDESGAFLRILDETKGKDLSRFEFPNDEQFDLKSTFSEMKAIGMPMAALPARPEQPWQNGFLGALPFKIAEVAELETPTRLEGKLEGNLGGPFVVFAKDFTTHNYNRIKQKLLAASKEPRVKYWVLLSHSPAIGLKHYIVDVFDKFDTPQNNLSEPYFDEFDERSFEPIQPKIAKEIFDSFESTSPESGPLTGIPFKYVSGGCEDRCHQMAREMLLRYDKVQPIKIWAFAHYVSDPMKWLEFETEYSPKCKTQWAFHTAPAVMTTQGILVIDPSTSNEPDPVMKWHARFGNENSKLYYTSHHVYKTKIGHCGVFESDPQFLTSDLMLKIYRISLRLQTSIHGAPPYDCPSSSTGETS